LKLELSEEKACSSLSSKVKYDVKEAKLERACGGG